jgi:hypothetical protein
MLARRIALRQLHLVVIVLALVVSARAQQVVSFAFPRWSADKATAVVADPLPTAPSDVDNKGCVNATVRQLGSDAQHYGSGLRRLPAGMISKSNLKWEVPVAVSTVVLIEAVDVHAARQFDLGSGTTAADNASNAVLGAEFGAAALTYLAGCRGAHSHARRAGFAAMEAAGYGLAADGLLKVAFNREYPTAPGGEGRFWHGGKAFPSGHAATSWAIASALAHEYPQKRWVKWTAYGTATSITILRLAALKHFPSDVVIGGTLGYVTGAWIGSNR